MKRVIIIGLLLISLLLVSGINGCIPSEQKEQIINQVKEKYSNINELKYTVEYSKSDSYSICRIFVMKKPDSYREATLVGLPCTSEDLFERFYEDSKEPYELEPSPPGTPEYQKPPQKPIFKDVIQNGHSVFIYTNYATELNRFPPILQDISEYLQHYLKIELPHNVGERVLGDELIVAELGAVSQIIYLLENDENLNINFIGEEEINNIQTYVIDFIISENYRTNIEDTEMEKTRIWVDKNTFVIMRKKDYYKVEDTIIQDIKEIIINRGISEEDFKPSTKLPLETISSSEWKLFCRAYGSECRLTEPESTKLWGEVHDLPE